MLDGTYQVQRFSYRVVEKWKPNYYWESIFQTFQRQSEPQLSSTIQELNLQTRLKASNSIRNRHLLQLANRAHRRNFF